MLFFCQLTWLYLSITLAMYLTTFFSSLSSRNSTINGNSNSNSNSKDGYQHQQQQIHRGPPITIRSIKNESEFLLRNLNIPEDCNILYSKRNLYQYTKAHILEMGIASRDRWQAEFFLINSYFSLMLDSKEIFSSLRELSSMSWPNPDDTIDEDADIGRLWFIEKEVFPSLFISSSSSSSSNTLYLWIFLRELSHYSSTLLVVYFILDQDQHTSAINNHGRYDFSANFLKNFLESDGLDDRSKILEPFWNWEYVGYDDGISIKSIEESITEQLSDDVKNLLYLGGDIGLFFGSYCYNKNELSLQRRADEDVCDGNRMHNILSLLGIVR